MVPEQDEPVIAPEHLAVDDEARHAEHAGGERRLDVVPMVDLRLWVLETGDQTVAGQPGKSGETGKPVIVDRAGPVGEDRSKEGPGKRGAVAEPAGGDGGQGVAPPGMHGPVRIDVGHGVEGGPAFRVSRAVARLALSRSAAA